MNRQELEFKATEMQVLFKNHSIIANNIQWNDEYKGKGRYILNQTLRPLEKGRLDVALDKKWGFDEGVSTYRARLDAGLYNRKSAQLHEPKRQDLNRSESYDEQLEITIKAYNKFEYQFYLTASSTQYEPNIQKIIYDNIQFL